MTAFHVDLDADRGVQQTFVVGILRKQLVDEPAVVRQLARGILVRVQTDAVDAAAELFLLPVRLVERPVEHALVLHPSAERLPFAAGAAVRQRGFRGQIHGFCAGLVPAELRQVDIPEQVRDSDGEQDAQNDQRNGQLYEGKAAFSAFSAPLRHDRCLLSVPVQKKGNSAPIYPFYILPSPVLPVKHRRRSSTASRPFPPFFAAFAVFCTAVRKKRPPERTSAAFLKFNGFFTVGGRSGTVKKNRLLYLIIYRASLPHGGASSPG